MHYLIRAVSMIIITGLLAAACGGRVAHPVKREQIGDERLLCGDIVFETKSNESKILALEKERQRIKKGNAVKIFFFPLIFPLFGIDTKIAPAEEISALEMRNIYLASMYEQKCGKSSKS